MRIRRPGNLTGAQLGFATALGIIGGVYIWRPFFLREKQVPKVKPTDE